MSEKKTKSKKFTRGEIYALLQEVEVNKTCVLKNDTCKAVLIEKRAVWQNIADVVTSIDPLTPIRTSQQCQVKFRDLKSECRNARLMNKMADGCGKKLPVPEPMFYDMMMQILGDDAGYWDGIKELPDERIEDADSDDLEEGEWTSMQQVNFSTDDKALLLGNANRAMPPRMKRKLTEDNDELYRVYLQKHIRLAEVQTRYYERKLRILEGESSSRGPSQGDIDVL